MIRLFFALLLALHSGCKLPGSTVDDPTKPAWATNVAKDDFGLAADLIVGNVTQRFRWIPSGTFKMGSPESEENRFHVETLHSVTLTHGFWMADSSCTQALWQMVMKNNPSRFTGDTNRPVERVSWDDVQVFLSQLNRQVAGLSACLPTEAEWEYACRAGTTGPYAGATLDTLGWYKDNSENTSHAVKTKNANAWGLYDMHGNVSQYCADIYGRYPRDPVTDPIGGELFNTGPNTNRTLRGGSWSEPASVCRSARRSGITQRDRFPSIGFRIVTCANRNR